MSNRPDEPARRAYWISQLEEAHQFMQTILEYPVDESCEKMASLRNAARSANLEVQFSTLKHVQNLDRLYYLREGQIDGFIAAAKEMNARGWVMKVEDGFRNRTMQKFVGRQPAVFDAILKSVIWELDGKLPTPEFFLRRAMTLTALMPKVGTHMSGSAIDISVFDRATGNEIDRGATYLEMSELTPMNSPFVSDQAKQNRREITAIMHRAGFVEYPYEFWHYNSGDAYDEYLNKTGKPARYGAIDWSGPETNTITPIANPRDPLNTVDEIRQQIDSSLKQFADRSA